MHSSLPKRNSTRWSGNNLFDLQGFIAYFFLGLTLEFCSIRCLDRSQNLRIIKLAKDFYVWHDAMSPDDSRKVLNRREKSDFVIERGDFFVTLTRSIAIPLHLLRPSNRWRGDRKSTRLNSSHM